MRYLLLALLVGWGAFAGTFAQAQTAVGTLTGRVLDAAQHPAEAATVSLLQLRDSVAVRGTLAGADGAFAFSAIPAGTYRLVVTAVGALPYRSPPLQVDAQHARLQLPGIQLRADPVKLQEVTVTGQQVLVEQQLDRTVVHVGALLNTAGTTALDVLEQAPGVRVDPNGTISLNGRAGVVIFIDDKPTYLAGADLEAYLRTLPATSLAQLELMTNPPAKYDAAGNAGVINLRTKKPQTRGFNLGLNLGIGQTKYTRTNNSLNFNYRLTRVNLFGTLGYVVQNGYANVDIARRSLTPGGSTSSLFAQQTAIRRQGYGGTTTLGADFYPSAATTWGIVLTGLARYPDNRFVGAGRLLDAGEQLTATVASQNREQGTFRNGSSNLNYRHQFREKGPELTASLDYLAYHTTTDQTFATTTTSPAGLVTAQDYLTGQLPATIRIYAAKTDYSHPLATGGRLEAGAKTSYTTTDNVADYFNATAGSSTPDYDKTNHFQYREGLNAAYLNVNKEWARLSLQAGLRLEQTLSQGHQLGNPLRRDSAFRRTYTNLFPTLFALYKLDSAATHQLKFSYGRRIDRPYYQDLNAFITPLDKFTYYVGNPYLQPSFSHQLEAGYLFKSRFTGTLSYSDTRDQVSETVEIVGGNYYSRPRNLGRTTVASLALTGSFTPARWLTGQVNGELTHLRTSGDFYTGRLDTRGTSVYLQGLLQGKAAGGWSFQLDGNYQSQRTDAQFTLRPKGRLNVAVAKSFSPAATLRLSVSDLLYTNINQGSITNLAGTEATFRNLGDTRGVLLTFSLRLGQQVAGQRQHESTGAEAEQSRVKN